MSDVTSYFILLLCLGIHTSDVRFALGWNPNGVLDVGVHELLQVISTRLIAASSNENGVKDTGYLIRSTSFRALSSYRMLKVEMGANQHILETKYDSESENAKLKRTFTQHMKGSSPEGMFSDYSRPKMRPPSHNR